MINILQQVEKSLHSRFYPASADDYFVLRLARGLGEPQASPHYAVLSSRYSQAKLLCAYRRAIAGIGNGLNPSKVFHLALASLSNNAGGGSVPRPRLMAVRVERRTIGIAVFAGTHLEGFRVRHLASAKVAAESTTAEFLRSVLYDNDCRAIAIESVSGEIRRQDLHRTVLQTCRAVGISVWELSREPVMNALQYPPPKSRQEIRKQMLNIWPLPDLKPSEECVLDAFALGLYLQTERLFGGDSLNGHSS
jgi:hypothetical protein